MKFRQYSIASDINTTSIFYLFLFPTKRLWEPLYLNNNVLTDKVKTYLDITKIKKTGRKTYTKFKFLISSVNLQNTSIIYNCLVVIFNTI